MLLMTTMFFLMSGGNGPNNAYNGMELNEQGEIVHRLSELDVERIRVDEWQAITNGSGIATNWTEVCHIVCFEAETAALTCSP
jgi:hypothetical protein